MSKKFYSYEGPLSNDPDDDNKKYQHTVSIRADASHESEFLKEIRKAHEVSLDMMSAIYDETLNIQNKLLLQVLGQCLQRPSEPSDYRRMKFVVRSEVIEYMMDVYFDDIHIGIVKLNNNFNLISQQSPKMGMTFIPDERFK
jgi:hypothetical protein